MKSSLAIAGALLAVTSSIALAADTAGWYFRGDIGVAMSGDADIGDKTPGPGSSFDNLCNGAGTCGLKLDEVDDSVSWSVGAGYRFSDNFRMDLVGSYKPDFELDDSIASAGGGRDTHKADIDVTTFMVSGYYDFSLDGSNWRPYLGGGVGVSDVDIGKTTVTNPVSGLVRSHGGSSETNTAWQLTAGFGIPMKNKTVMDLSYKYVDAGDIDSGSSTVSGNFGAVTFPFNGVEGDMTYHEISIGLRF